MKPFVMHTSYPTRIASVFNGYPFALFHALNQRPSYIGLCPPLEGSTTGAKSKPRTYREWRTTGEGRIGVRREPVNNANGSKLPWEQAQSTCDRRRVAGDDN
ncbi:hypothetical protein Trydic_g15254 [Trypoxylus dichotomus]